MEENTVRIISIRQITHDVLRFQVEKPEGYVFVPGQATDLSINLPELRNRKRPFTFTGLRSDPFLEFIIKIYPAHKGFTSELAKLRPGDELIVRKPWGAISYQGKGTFIAGGSGITPFIAILRDLNTRNEVTGNRLIFANKTKADIILENELKEIMGSDFINILSEETAEGYFHGFITEDFLRDHVSDLNGRFYLCGPMPMMNSVKKQLAGLGADRNSIIVEF